MELSKPYPSQDQALVPIRFNTTFNEKKSERIPRSLFLYQHIVLCKVNLL